MAEPQPPDVHEGASTPTGPPAAASAAAEAAALSSLDNKKMDEPAAAPKKDVDLKALNDAMKALGSGGSGAGGGGKKAAPSQSKAGEPQKLVKVDAADVGVLVSFELVEVREAVC